MGKKSLHKTGGAGIVPESLKCEYCKNPIGIDVVQPRLSWVLKPAGKKTRSLYQTAYQILVGSSPEILSSDRGDMWDSGKVFSNENSQIRYAGKPLKSTMRCWWKVRVWDQKNRISAWSKPAFWEMGLLEQKDWSGAKWIGIDWQPRVPEGTEDIPVGDWIWHPEFRGHQTVYLRQYLDIKSGLRITSARVRMAVYACGSIYINGKHIGDCGTLLYTTDFDITSELKPGRNTILIQANSWQNMNTWQASAGVLFGLLVRYEDGSTEKILSDSSWSASEETPGEWKGIDYEPKKWVNAKVVLKYGDAPWGRLPVAPEPFPSPLFRKVFELKKSIRQARAYICGLGYYEFYLNGKKVGDNVLDPGQTNYEHYAFYVTYDITGYLKKGKNAAGIMLGNGWYNQDLVWGGLVYGKPGAICLIKVSYSDNSTETIVSDQTWKVAEGPITFNNVYAGERYDARKEIPDWAKPGLDDSGWKNAILREPLTPRLVAQSIPPIKRMGNIRPVKITSPKPGVWIFDMGQNFAGWVKLRVRAPAGTAIRLRFTEVLYPDGTIDSNSTGVFATGVVQTDCYICKGEKEEVWEPRFTYHGFRYVEMTGFPGRPNLDMIEGVVVHTSVEKNGSFACSNNLINRIHKTALWTELSNLHSIPTDCPHRERCGWLGDAHVSAEMTIYNFDMAQFWTKYMNDIETSLGQGGSTATGKPASPGIPCNISTGKRTCGEARPDWGSAIAQIPWYMYLYYRDTDVFAHHYPHIKRWVDYLTAMAKDNIVEDGFGDWCPPGDNTAMECPPPLTSTALYYFDALLLSKMAKLLGKKEDAQNYANLASAIKTAFIKKFFNQQENTFGCQTADAIALYLDLVPEGKYKEIAESLNRDVLEKHKGHMSTGILGSRHLYWALSNYGYDSTAFGILTKTDFPGFAYMFSQGATTFWEALVPASKDGVKPVFSFNHPMQGGFDAWFYYGVVGISPVAEEPGFRKIVLNPHLVNELKWVKAIYDSINGRIVSEWENRKNKFKWHILIPPNTSARVLVPAEDRSSVSEKGKFKGVKFLGMEDGRAVYEIGSGEYDFIVAKK